MLKLKGYYSVN